MEPKVKQLIKILIGAAWIDGKVQIEERKYLHQLAQNKGVADDPELRPWLYGLKSVSAAECYTWIEDYLGQQPTQENCQQMIEAVSALIYSDGDVVNDEAKLLTQLQLVPAGGGSDRFFKPVVKAIRKLYAHWLEA